MRCPPPIDLVQYAFGDAPSQENPRVVLHVNGCASCLDSVRALRETASPLRNDAWRDVAPSTACLTEGEIAAAAEGAGGMERGRWLAHLAGCGACRSRFAMVTRLLRDVAVAAELERLEGRTLEAIRRRPRSRQLAAAATLAAAAVLGVMLRPEAIQAPSPPSETVRPPHRESAITTTVAPRIVGPVGPASLADTLVWTSVPHAARYRIRVFDREGTLVWDARTSDTALSIPAHLRADTTNAYLWKVEARTGWDRWVSSEWRDLVVRPGAGRR